MKLVILAIAAATLASCAKKSNPAPSSYNSSSTGYVTPAK